MTDRCDFDKILLLLAPIFSVILFACQPSQSSLPKGYLTLGTDNWLAEIPVCLFDADPRHEPLLEQIRTALDDE